MNENLPKPMFDALAREAKPAAHPSADVLAAFVEHALADGEKHSVADHLASCAECRDVVFLASNAAEESGAEEQLVAAARATPRWSWRQSLAWAAPVAAVLLLAGGYFVWHGTEKIATGPELASKRAAEAPVQPSEQTQKPAVEQYSAAVAPPKAAAKPQVAAAPAKTPPATKAQPTSAAIVATNAAEAGPAENKEQGSKVETAKTSPQAITIGGAMGSVAPVPKASGFAPSAGDSDAPRQFGTADSLSVAVNRAVSGAARTAHPGWRITNEGGLEHLTSDEGWTNAFPEQRRVFRVVAVIGSQVWAGGDGGALFHSSDGGKHWTKASLATGEGAETSAIVSIRFSDTQSGEVITQGGSSYNTTDGGATWTKR